MDVSDIYVTTNTSLVCTRFDTIFKLDYNLIPKYTPHLDNDLLSKETQTKVIKCLNKGLIRHYFSYVGIMLGIYFICIGSLIGGYFLYIERNNIGFGFFIGIFVLSFLISVRGNLIKKNILKRGLGKMMKVVDSINEEILREDEIILVHPKSVFQIEHDRNTVKRDDAIN